MKKPNILVMGDGAERLAMIAIDLADEDMAIQLAQVLATHTGRSVTVRNADGDILDMIRAGERH